MTNTIALLAPETISRRILLIRKQKVMLDADLAELYGVETRTLNQTVRRNAERFPADFMFQLTQEEKQEVITNCDHLARLKFSPVLPNAFTEHGALMLGSQPDRRHPPDDQCAGKNQPPHRFHRRSESQEMSQKDISVAKAKGRPMLTWVGKKPLARVTAFPAQHIETVPALARRLR